MSKRLEELRKGCGHIILKEYNNCGQDNITKDRIKPYCDKCQARINEREKMEKEVKDVLNKFVFAQYSDMGMAEGNQNNLKKDFEKELGLSSEDET